MLRASLFTIRVGEQDVAIGPNNLLQVVLGTVDRAVDRLRAQERADVVSRLMRDVSFEKAQVALTTYCIALMQNLPEDDQQQLLDDVGELASSEVDERIKSLVFGLALMNFVGEDVLRAAIESLGDRIKPEPGETSDTA